MSKKVKTFDEKQRKLTKAEQAALEHIRNKSNPVPKQFGQNPLTPDEMKLQDMVDLTEKKKGSYKGEGIITEETLKQEEIREQEEAKRFEEEFNRQLDEWIKEDHISQYKDVEFDHDDYLVRIFKMDVSGFDRFKSLEYEWSQIKGNWKLKDIPATDNVFPIIKILKLGDNIKSDKHSPGDICLVPSSDVMGEDWNPEFMQIAQFARSQGIKPKVPPELRQLIPNVEKNWGRYMFVRPWIPEPEEADYLTYLIPEAKVRGRYNRS